MPSHQPLSRNRPKRPPEARKSDKNTANTQQVRFFKLYFDLNVPSAENRRLFSIEFQLHTNSPNTLWLPVVFRAWHRLLMVVFVSSSDWLSTIFALSVVTRDL